MNIIMLFECLLLQGGGHVQNSVNMYLTVQGERGVATHSYLVKGFGRTTLVCTPNHQQRFKIQVLVSNNKQLKRNRSLLINLFTWSFDVGCVYYPV